MVGACFPCSTPEQRGTGLRDLTGPRRSPANYWDSRHTSLVLAPCASTDSTRQGLIQHHLTPRLFTNSSKTLFPTRPQPPPPPPSILPCPSTSSPQAALHPIQPILLQHLHPKHSIDLSGLISSNSCALPFSTVPFICELHPLPPSLKFNLLPSVYIHTNIMGLRAGADSPPAAEMPSAMPSVAPLTNGAPQSNGANGTSTPAHLSADDNIRRFEAPSRSLSPSSAQALFHSKTRCFV